MDMMEIRRKILSNPPLVAPGYMKVEYIQSTNWQRIETNYIPTKDDEFECTYQFDKLTGRMQCLFSAGKGTYQLIALANTGNSLGAYYYAKYFASGGAKYLYSYNSEGVWYTMRVASSGVFSDNGVTVTSPYEHELDGNDTTLFVFRRRDLNDNFIGKLKSFIITNSDTLKMNLVPCVRIADNVAGVYDTVSKIFYSCPESSYPFIAGGTAY